MDSKSKIILAAIAGVALVFGYAGFSLISKAGSQRSQASASTTPVRISGQAQIGGPFTLVNHLGETVTHEDFAGKAKLIYFGFTYCPDICPTALQTLNVALNQLGEEERAQFQPILISIDPERDTPEALALYVSAPAFPDNLIGLTGTPEQVAAAAQAYRVYYARIEDEGSMAEYLMDHTSVIFLMDQNDQFADLFTDGSDPLTIASRLQYFLQEQLIN